MPKTSAATARPPAVATTMLRGVSLDAGSLAVLAAGAAALVPALGPALLPGPTAALAAWLGLGAGLSGAVGQKLAATTSPAAGWTTIAAGPCGSRASITCRPGATSSTSPRGAVPTTGPPSTVTGAPAGARTSICAV